MPLVAAAIAVVFVALDSFLSLFTESKYALSVSPTDRNLSQQQKTTHSLQVGCVCVYRPVLGDFYDLRQ